MPPEKTELLTRIEKFSERLAQGGYEAALLRYPLNIFYFTGAFVDGHLVITSQKRAFLLVYRTRARLFEDSPVEAQVFRSLKKLPQFLKELGIKKLGLEADRLSAALFWRYQKLLADFELGDVSPFLRELRAVKSPYEISCLKQAAEVLAKALWAFLPQLRPGMTELEAAGLLEKELRRLGHPAFTRTSGFGQELAYGHLLSGEAATVPSYLTTGQGGAGVYGFPQGPSFKKIKENEPILIDYAGWFEGYMVDQSRLFCLGEIPKKALRIFEKILALMEALEELLFPGTLARKIYEEAQKFAAKEGLEPCFMAHGPEKVPFVGHGVGLEIDEWPPIAQVEIPLKEGMVIALEPKCHVPGLGVIGLEDTFLVTDKGPRRLTTFPRGFQKLIF